MMNRAQVGRLPLVCALLVALVTGGMTLLPSAYAEEGVVPQEATIPIYDASGLLSMVNDPYASYRLMCDVDLAGVPWTPFAFYGSLDGGGHAILNASVTGVAQERRTTYDGNRIPYDTALSGLFGLLEGASVRDVALLGIDVNVQTSEPTFVGTLCGYMSDSTIEGCTVVGQATLNTTGTSFGVGGFAGFGSGRIANSTADVTLVCCDLDAENKDEQFMGGAYAGGYIDLENDHVTIAGYDSDHGYVHDGGLVGIYLLYDSDEYEGSITGNSVEGFITFFEDNWDRRAYCEPLVGECMNPWNVSITDNVDSFVRDERFEYDINLVPHGCQSPVWDEQHVDGSCTEHGYTLRTCTICGYAQRTAWEPVAHEVETWVPVEEGDDGLVVQDGTCVRCGAQVFERVPQEQAADSVETADAEAEAQGDVTQGGGITVGHCVSVALLFVIVGGLAIGLVVSRGNRRSQTPRTR